MTKKNDDHKTNNSAKITKISKSNKKSTKWNSQFMALIIQDCKFSHFAA